jgi:organic radical activating enzyme
MPDASSSADGGRQAAGYASGGRHAPVGRCVTPYTWEILDCVDVLVDGRFVSALYSPALRFRGSSNQRVIDVARTREGDAVVLWDDDPIYAGYEREALASAAANGHHVRNNASSVAEDRLGTRRTV